MGAPDPRKQPRTQLTDFRIYRQLRSYTRTDPSPSRVKPLPVQLLHHVRQQAVVSGNATDLAVSDLAYLAFFWLLRPGEYCTSSDTQPFRLCDVQLFIGDTRMPPTTAPLEDIQRATFATLTFTTQKNGVRGEVIGHARSGHPDACPVLATVRRILYLRNNGALPTAALCSVRRQGRWTTITSHLITETIRLSATLIGPTLGFLPADVSARSARAGGAMALLCGRVDTSIIQLVGRWRSDVMLRYLHLQAFPLMKHFARTMLTAGSFQLVPGQNVPPSVAPLLAKVPNTLP